MNRKLNPLTILATLAFCSSALAATAQPSEQAQFQNYSSCPSTGKRGGPCPGYHIGYKVALCAGGQDRWTNMVWLHDAAWREQQRREANCVKRPANQPEKSAAQR